MTEYFAKKLNCSEFDPWISELEVKAFQCFPLLLDFIMHVFHL